MRAIMRNSAGTFIYWCLRPDTKVKYVTLARLVVRTINQDLSRYGSYVCSRSEPLKAKVNQ